MAVYRLIYDVPEAELFRIKQTIRLEQDQVESLKNFLYKLPTHISIYLEEVK